MEYYSVKQIAERRGVSEQAIYKQLKVHQKELEGHIRIEKGKKWYDQVVVDLLDEASTQSAPVIVETAEKNEVEELQNRIKELEAKIDQYEESVRKSNELVTKLSEDAVKNAELVAESKLYIEQKKAVDEKNKELEIELKEQTQKKYEEKSRADLAEKDLEHARTDLARALEEAASYKRTIFGFYKKTKK